MTAAEKILIVGNPNPVHVGAHFFNASRRLGLESRILDIRKADSPFWLARQWNWRFRSHRPARLSTFSQEVLRECLAYGPKWLLATGFSPVDAKALETIQEKGTLCLNYLTDDPWGKSHRSEWFFKSLSVYDGVFSPRQAGLQELQRLCTGNVEYLPFAYAPETHYPEVLNDEEKARFASDVVFIGGADEDRLPYVTALIRAGYRVRLYGGYWDRYPSTRAHAFGNADDRTMRMALAAAKMALCFVRRANRDGNSMRTFELPAMLSCMLTQDTEEHRAIFGEEGKATLYFRNVDEMMQKIKQLMGDSTKRESLASTAYAIIVSGGKHAYEDRLRTMLKIR